MGAKHYGDILGWKVSPTGNGEGYGIEGYPQLTPAEAGVVQSIVQQFRVQSREEVSVEAIESTIDHYCTAHLIALEEEQKEYLRWLVQEEIEHYGPLSRLLQDEEIEEIAITGLGEKNPVRVYVAGKGWKDTNLHYFREERVKGLVNRMARGSGRRLTLQTPQLNAVLEDGSRLHAAMQPVTFNSTCATIRKFRQHRFTVQELIRLDNATAEFFALMHLALEVDCSVLVCGNTGSGKTTLLNALFGFVPMQERIILVEETPELQIRQPHQLKLYANPVLGITMQGLITETLRMRPDRVVVGEIRNREEVAAFADTLRAGQGKGSYGTFHAKSCTEAVSRLCNLGIPEADIAGVEIMVVQKRWTRNFRDSRKSVEQRRVSEVCEVFRDGGKLRLNPVFRYDFRRNQLAQCGKPVLILRKAQQSFRMSERGMEQEWKRRAKELGEEAESGKMAGKRVGQGKARACFSSRKREYGLAQHTE